jgi:hypothetical protein
LLKQAFTIAPFFLHPNPTKSFHFEMDASDFTIGAILSQADEVGVLHLVTYYSRKLTTQEINYPIDEKELLPIIVALKKGGPIWPECNTAFKWL